MQGLDAPTIFVLCAFINVLIAAATFISERARIVENGTGLMVLGMLLMATAFGAFGMRGPVPDWVAPVIGNGALAASAYAFLRAFQQLGGAVRRNLARLSLIGVPLTILLNVVFLVAAGDTPLRSGVSGVVAGALYTLPGILLLRRPESWEGRMHRLIAAAFFSGAAFMLANGAWDLFFATPATYRAQPNPVDVFLAPVLVAVVVLGSFGFLLMLRERDLLRLAMLDGLTGAMNRRAMVDAMQRALGFAQRTGASCSLLMLDLDHFKRVNDSHGHEAGDRVLRHVAALIGRLVRRDDVWGRYGGEEFALLLQGTPADEAMAFAARLRQALAAQPAALAHGPLGVTASIGVAQWHPGTAPDASRMLEEADRAMYAAKQQGRDRAVLREAAGTPEV